MTQKATAVKRRKKQLQGGSLRKVMADEIKRVLAKYGNEGAERSIDCSAVELGITPRSLRNWMAPVDKGGWEELQITAKQAMDKLLKTSMKKKNAKASARKRKLAFA